MARPRGIRCRWRGLGALLVAFASLAVLACNTTPTDGFHFTAVNQTGRPITVTHSPAWALNRGGGRVQPENYDAGSNVATTQVFKVGQLEKRSSRGISETANFVVAPGESAKFSTEWELDDDTGRRARAMHRFIGRYDDREVIVDLTWDQLKARDYVVTFTR